MKRITPLLSLLATLIALALVVAVPAASAAEGTAKQPATATAEKTGVTSAEEAKAKVKAQEESAAKRRAASSEFEREKLDQGAFKEDEKSAKGEDSGSGSNSGGSALRFIFGLAVVLGAIYGVHWLLKKWGQSKLQGVSGRTGVIDVVATTALAQGRALHLVRVGEELVLVGATDQSITRIGEVDANMFAASQGNAGNGEFQAMLSGAMLGNQPGVPQGMGGAGSTNQPFIKRFLDNLRLSTAR